MVLKKNLKTNILKSRFLKFAIIGGIATLTHAINYLLFLKVFNISEYISNVIGFTFALSISYYGQRYWTFSDKKIQNENKTKFKFFISSLLSIILNTLWVFITVNMFNCKPEYAAFGIVFVTPVMIFITLSLWVFK